MPADPRDMDHSPASSAAPNVLVTAIGSLSAEPVIASLRRFGVGRIVGCDIHPQAWLASAAGVDAFLQVPLAASEPDLYLQVLGDLCSRHAISHLIPLTDVEVDLFARRAAALPRGVTICAPLDRAALLRDKYAWQQVLRQSFPDHVIPTATFSEAIAGALAFPLIGKPRNGRSMQGFVKVPALADLSAIGSTIDRDSYIFQPLLTSAVFVVDVLRDRHISKTVTVGRRELTRTANGAGLAVQLEPSAELGRIATELADALDIHGCINFEFMRADDRYLLMDINPRFSAGVGVSAEAGYDMVQNCLKLHMGLPTGEQISYAETIFSRRIGTFERIGE
ncbi:ATP-grasp domain-containing protein [Neorhizobium sp. NPDC001467]|uniref:ATP-grasp domain-containing protein n=1 Tax=Neorhizobium sp. NPDC001467 TaxID=3390595 RepID=UPI003D01ADFE